MTDIGPPPIPNPHSPFPSPYSVVPGPSPPPPIHNACMPRPFQALRQARLNRHEIAGSLGDMGTFLPLLVGMAAQNGLGALIWIAKDWGNMALVLVGMVCISLTVLVADLIMNRIERLLLPWERHRDL